MKTFTVLLLIIGLALHAMAQNKDPHSGKLVYGTMLMAGAPLSMYGAWINFKGCEDDPDGFFMDMPCFYKPYMGPLFFVASIAQFSIGLKMVNKRARLRKKAVELSLHPMQLGISLRF